MRKIVAIVLLAAAGIFVVTMVVKNRSITLRGAVIRHSEDPAREVPVAGVQVTATDGPLVARTQTNASGAFAISLRRSVVRRHPLTLSFTHSDYKPAQIQDPAGDRLYIVTMIPNPAAAPPSTAEHPLVHIGNISIRYTLKTEEVVDVGSGVKTFQITNKGDVPCNGHPPCSPDGKWKAALGSASIDAGPQNEFRDGRVSCIAGPCPFTKVIKDDFSHGGRVISVTVLDWSDTTTFLLQAEAVRHVLTDSTQKSFPVIFDRTMSFSLPGAAQGICIEAEVDGMPIVFPIVPNLSVAWATCEEEPEPQNDALFRCELKPGYIFR